MGLAYGIGGLIKVPPQAITGKGVPTASFKAVLGAMYFDITDASNPVLYIYDGNNWQLGGSEEATTTSFGVVELATLSELQNGNAPGNQVPTSNDVATVIAGIVVGAVPPANENQAGIAEIATQAETDAGLLDDKIVSPLKLANFISGGGGAGSFTDLTATGAVTFTGATGALSMTSTSASSLGVTGAGIDLTLDSASGQLILTGGEAAINAVRIQADNAAGGIDADAGTGGITIDTTGAFSIDGAAASNVTTTGAGIDLTLSSVLGSVLVSSTEDAALAIRLHANGGTSETIQIHSDQGTGVASIGLLSDVGGLTLRATGLASNDAINLEAAAGGIDMNAALQINIATSQSAADSIVIESTGGGIDILASGAAAGEDIDIIATGSSVNITSTENAVQAIYIRANGGVTETVQIHSDQGTGAASVLILSDVGGLTLQSGLGNADAINLVTSAVGGGIDIDSGTAGIIADTTGAISLDSAAASNFTVTGAFDLTLASTLGAVNISSGEANADSINIDSTGGFDLDAALQVNITSSQAAADAIRILASAGGIDVDAVGGAGLDISIVNTGGSLILQATESDVNAIVINASGVAGGVNMDAGTSGVIVDTTGAISLDSAAASNFTVTGAFDLTLNSTAGSVNLTAGEVAADSMVLTNNGMDIVIAGAAGRDFDLTNTGGSVNITATENVSDAIVITASGAGGGITLDPGTAGVNVAGDLNLTDVATKISMNGGAVTDFIGRATLVAGTVTVANTNIAAGDRIFVTRSALNGSPALGFPITTISAGASFTIASFSAAGAAVATDVSTFDYVIVRQT